MAPVTNESIPHPVRTTDPIKEVLTRQCGGFVPGTLRFTLHPPSHATTPPPKSQRNILKNNKVPKTAPADIPMPSIDISRGETAPEVLPNHMELNF